VKAVLRRFQRVIKVCNEAVEEDGSEEMEERRKGQRRKGDPKEEKDDDEPEPCGGQVEAEATEVAPTRKLARDAARKEAKKDARTECREKVCDAGKKCRFKLERTVIRVRPTQEIPEPRSYTAVATVYGKCECK
jgi:hypothetical protein